MVTKVFQILLFLSPICVGTNINMDMFDITFFRTGVVALFVAMLFDHQRRILPSPLRIIIASLLGLVFGSVVVHVFMPSALHNSLNLFLAALAFCIVYMHYDSRKDLSKYIIAAAALNLLFFYVQKAGFDPIWNVRPYAGQEGAMLGNQPRLITYFSLVTPFLPLRWLFWSVLLGIGTKQYAIFIGVAVVMFLKLKTYRERILFAVMLVFAGYSVWAHIYDSLVYRFTAAWAPALTMFFKQPLIGLGLGERPFPEMGVIGNSYLQLIMGVGILATVWYGYAAKQLWQMRPQGDKAPIICLALVALVEYPLEIPRLWYLIIAIVITFLIKKEWADA